LYASTIEEFERALRDAAASDITTVVQVCTDPQIPAPSSEAWWDVPVAEVSALDSTLSARERYEGAKATQHTYLKTPNTVRTP